MVERFVFNNLVYKCSDSKYLLMNLTNFRREFVTNETLIRLSELSNKCQNEEPFTQDELQFLEPFFRRKQIFTNEFSQKIDSYIEAQSSINLVQIPIRSITINLTHSCNFACTYCYQECYKSKSNFSRSMTPDDIDKIAEYIHLPFFDASELEEIVVTGGEPLLSPNIPTIKYILKTFPSSRKVLFTNGANILRFKHEIPFDLFDEYQISLDGTNEVIRAVNKSSDIFENIILGILYLASLGKQISVVTMWTNELEDNLAQFIYEIKKQGLVDMENVKLKFVLPQNYYSTEPLHKHFLNWNYLSDVIKKYNPILHEIGTNLDLYPEAMTLSSAIHRKANSRHNLKYKKCDLMSTLPAVFSPDGFVYWCLCLGNLNGAIGNFHTQALFRERVEHLSNRTVFTIEECRKCKLKYLCGGGCVLPLTNVQRNCHAPSCGMFASDYFWQHLEDFI